MEVAGLGFKWFGRCRVWQGIGTIGRVRVHGWPVGVMVVPSLKPAPAPVKRDPPSKPVSAAFPPRA